MTVVDASVWISYLVWEDEHHAETRAWINRRPLHTRWCSAPSLLLIEVAGAIARRRGRTDAALRLVARLSSTPSLDLHPFDAERLQEYVALAAQLRLRAPDVFYVALAHELGVKLVTWDIQQRTRGASYVEALTPTEALLSGG